MDSNFPDHVMVIGDKGEPSAVIDMTRLQSDATILMYRLAAVAGDDDAVDSEAETWLSSVSPDYAGYVSASALSLTVRCILAPLLEVLDRAVPGHDFRRALAEARDHAIRTLGATDGSGH
jgi:hypothetical protein